MALSRKTTRRKSLVELRAFVSWWPNKKLATKVLSRKTTRRKNFVDLRAFASWWLLLFSLPQRLKDTIPIAIGTQREYLVNLRVLVS